MAFIIYNLSVFSNSKSIQRFREVHEYFVFAGTSQHGAWIYLSCTSMTSEITATTKLMLFCKTLRCLWLLFCRDDGFRAFSPFTFYYFVDELRNNFMFMWYRKTVRVSRPSSLEFCQQSLLIRCGITVSNWMMCVHYTTYWLQGKQRAGDARRTNVYLQTFAPNVRQSIAPDLFP